MSKEWQRSSTGLTKEFNFPDFKSALEFVNKIGILAEQANHHPDILLSWGKVIVTLFSHDELSVTDKDFRLAEKIDII